MKDTIKWLAVIALSLLIWVVLGFMIHFAIGIIRDDNKFGYLESILVSGIIWTVWYFFLGGYEHFWINPDSDTGIILQDYFQLPPKKLSDAQITGPLFVPKGQEAVFTGINPKFPWQIQVGKPISLVTVSPFEHTTTASDKRRIRYEVTFKVLLTPVRSEYLPRYLLTDDSNAGDFFKSQIAMAIQSAFENAENGDEIAKDHKKFSKDHIDKLFDGPEKISDEENRYGRFTNNPFIESIRRNPDDLDVAQIPTIIGEVSKGVDELQGKNIPPNQIAQLIMAALGQRTTMENVNIDLSGGNTSQQQNPSNQGNRRKKGRR